MPISGKPEIGRPGMTTESVDLTTGIPASDTLPMVKYQPAPLDRTFAALADPTRRALLARLGRA
jgi:hypothetical protein